MKLSFDYKGIKISYNLTYKKAKAISIKVTEDGQVKVIAPIGTSVYAVMDKVKGYAPWIINELMPTQQETYKIVEPTLKDQYTYLGKNYKLELTENKELDNEVVKLVRGKFNVETSDINNITAIRGAIVKWYSDKLLLKIKERLNIYKDSFRAIPEKIEIIDERKTLLNLNSNQIEVNASLGMLSVDVLDYILVSALIALNKVENKEELLNVLLPEHEKSAKWFNENQNTLVL